MVTRQNRHGQSWAQWAWTELATGYGQRWAQHSGYGQSWAWWLWTELGMVDMEAAGVGERAEEIMDDLRTAMFPKKVLLAKKNRWRERQRRSL